MIPEFLEWTKIARLSREIVITEKIDGTNGVIYVPEDPSEKVIAGSRSRWLTSDVPDNHGFARWVAENSAELRGLSPGYHYGEWWGKGIGKRYSQHAPDHKQFALFNVSRWGEERPACCSVVPVLDRGLFRTDLVDGAISRLRETGSVACPGCMRPEGVVIFHTASGYLFKKTLEKDESHKSEASS